MLLRRVGLGEDQRHLGDVAERDPHLAAGDPPAAVDLLGAGAQVGGVGAGVGLGQPEAAERLAASTAAAASAASAPRCPSARSSRRRARSGPRPRCASPSRRGRPPRRSGRSRCSRARGRRTPRRPARPGSPSRRAGGRARGRSFCARSESRARGTTSLSTKSRAVSGDQPLLVGELDHRGSARRCRARRRDRRASNASRRLGGARARRSKRGLVDRRDRLDLAHGRGEERLRRRRAGRRAAYSPSSTSSASTMPPAGDRVEDPGSERRGPQLAVGDPEDRRGRRLEHDPVRAHEQRLVGAARPWRSGSPACWRRRRAT